MDNLNLEEFNPKRAEVIALADKYRGLVIKDINDVEGYEAVHKAQMELVHTRTDIVKSSKAARENAVAYNKAVLKLEKDLIAEIEPVELILKNQKENIDALKAKASRVALLPSRRAKLVEVEATLSDDEIINMDANQFQDFLNQAKHTQLVAHEEKLKLEKEKIDKEREALEKEKHDAEIEKAARIKAEKEADDKRIRDAKAAEDKRIADLKKVEDDKLAAIQAEKDKSAKALRDADDKAALAKLQADKEKQDIIDENNRKEAERVRLAAEKRAEDDRLIVKEQAAKAELTKKAAYLAFLIANGVTKANLADFYIKNDGKTAVLYKKLAEYKL